LQHVKSIAQYALGNEVAGSGSMLAACRTEFVAASAVSSGGAVGALIAGAAFDTLVASIRAGNISVGDIPAVHRDIVRCAMEGGSILEELEDLFTDVGTDATFMES
jgi:hypothetical protein